MGSALITYDFVLVTDEAVAELRREKAEEAMAAFATRSAAFLGLAAVLCVLVGEASAQQLSPSFYSRSCPNLASIVRSGMTSALQTERRMGASILRLFFHD